MDMQMQIFQNDQFGEVRTILRDGEPWFVAADVCRVLEIKNPAQAVERLDDDERSMQNIGRQGDAYIVNEPGLYTLIIRSNKPQAREFRRWVTHDVLPAIRKTGAYMTPAVQEQLNDRLARLENALTNLVPSDPDAEVKRVREHNAQLLQTVYGVHSNVTGNPAYLPRLYPDMLESGLTTLEETAAIIGITAKSFREFLHRDGYIYLTNKPNVFMPYTDTNHGFFELRDIGRQWSDVQWYFTRTGRRFFIDLLRPAM